MDAIERLAASDWRRLRQVRLRALTDTPDAFGRTAAEEAQMPPADWRRRLDRPDVATFVAKLDDGDVGLVTALADDTEETDAWLVGMWVDPTVRRLGLGSALVDAAVSWCQTAGRRRLLLDVADNNGAAVRFYETYGFRRTGKTGTLPPPRTHVTEHERLLEL